MKGVVTGKQCQCTVCNRTFSTENNFMKHRVGEYGSKVCVSPDTIGMYKKNGVWRGMPREDVSDDK